MVKVKLLKKQAEMLRDLANIYARYGGAEGFSADEWNNISIRFYSALLSTTEEKE